MQFFGCLFALFWGASCMMIGGWLFGGWGIILGAAVAVFTMGRTTWGTFGSAGEGGVWDNDDELIQRRQVFSRIVFLVSGHIAQADGRVTEQEIRCAEELIEEFGLNPEQRGHAMHYFNLGTRPGFDLGGSLQELAGACRSEPSLIATFIGIQVAMACADGELSPSEEQIIYTCCTALGYPESRVRAIIDQYLGHARRAGSVPDAAVNLDWAYDVLEVEPSMPMEEVQRAYARKMKDFHPDKLASKGLPKEFMEFATERTKQFTKAYQAIKKAKGK